jgi:peroxiredoxin
MLTPSTRFAWLPLLVLGVAGVAAVAAVPVMGSPPAPEGGELLGSRPPEWEVEGWVRSPPLRLADLRGKAVLVRWWTGPECPFCRASAPALRRLHEVYARRGLVVIGFYHHKSAAPLDPGRVAAYADELGFTFPLAIDREWRTLRRWWLDGSAERSFTSVSFLLDRGGVIRWIHPGGELIAGGPEWKTLVGLLEEIP